MIIRKTH